MIQLTIFNRSELHVAVDYAGRSQSGRSSCIVLPSASVSLSVSSIRSRLLLSTASKSEWTTLDEKVSVNADTFQVKFPSAFGAQWKAVRVEHSCPWRLYRSKVSRQHHRLLVLSKRNLGTFLSDLPDSVPLSALTLPGTHDTMALYGWPISQCQSIATPLAVQLQSGIRVLDVRLALKSEGLVAYHGPYPQRVSFQHILKTIHDFLTTSETCGEMVVMSIKQEDFMIVPPPIFSQRVRDEIVGSLGGMDMWFLSNRIPTLGEVRGKVVMFSRFGGDGNGWKDGLEGIGIHPTMWPDSKKEGFTWECKNTLVQTHDWYSVPSFLSIPEKVGLATRILLPPPGNLPTPMLSISFFSASSFPLGLPPTIARGFGWPKFGFGVDGVNSRFGSWLLDLLGNPKEPRVRGWAFMDFYSDPEDNAVVPLLVECNFRGRVSGQEGWP